MRLYFITCQRYDSTFFLLLLATRRVPVVEQNYLPYKRAQVFCPIYGLVYSIDFDRFLFGMMSSVLLRHIISIGLSHEKPVMCFSFIVLNTLYQVGFLFELFNILTCRSLYLRKFTSFGLWWIIIPHLLNFNKK